MEPEATVSKADKEKAEWVNENTKNCFGVVFNSGRDIEMLWEVMPDAAPRLKAVNQALLTRLSKYGFNYAEQDLIGKYPIEVMNLLGADHAAIKLCVERYETALATKTPVEYEILHYVSGKKYHAENQMIPILDDRGNCTHLFYNSHDLTNIKRIEANLKEYDIRYRSLVNTMQEGLVRVDRDWRIIYANQRFIGMSGYDRTDLLETSFLDFLSPESFEEAEEKLKNKNGRGIYEFEFMKPDGERLYLSVSTSALCEDTAGHLGEVWVISDISDRKIAEEELTRLNRSLECKVKERTNELKSLNTALKVLLKKREEDKKEIEKNIFKNWEMVVQPFLQSLKDTLKADDQLHLFSILENSLKELITPFSRKMTDPMISLTPAEVRIAAMIKQGFTNKEIADALHNSPKTIKNHRENIRKKLGLKHKGINLRTFLQSA